MPSQAAASPALPAHPRNKSRRPNAVMAVCAALIGALPLLATAQSVLVLDSGEDARRCSNAATIAATLGNASREDLDTCARALDFTALRARDRAGTLVNQGIVAAALGEQDAAMASYERAIAMMPELPEPYVGRGNVLFLRGDLAGAVAEYDRAIALGISRRHIALLNRGMARERLGQLEAAEQDYREAQALAPEWPLPKPRIERVVAKRKAAGTKSN